VTAPAPRPDRGFTLLEVLVAVAILSLSMASLLGSQIDSMRATRYAQGVTAAAFLAEYQLTEIEWQQNQYGWQTSDVDYDGDFADQGWPDIEYHCLVDFVELPDYTDMLDAKTDADREEGDDSLVMDAGDQAFGAIGMVWPIVKQAIEKSIRKATCTVRWQDGKLEHELTTQTFWTDPQKLAEIPALGGEATGESDPSGADEPGGDPAQPGGGGTGSPTSPVNPGLTPGAGSGMMGGRG
jgi:prepilin-type N-terminal cleavage/methylation domain-containing protein